MDHTTHVTPISATRSAATRIFFKTHGEISKWHLHRFTHSPAKPDMSLAVEGDSSYCCSSGASIVRPVRMPIPAVLPARTTALLNHKAGTARWSLWSPTNDTTIKFDKLDLHPTVTATSEPPPPVDALPQNETDETFHRVIQSLPQPFSAAVLNSGMCTFSYNAD